MYLLDINGKFAISQNIIYFIPTMRKTDLSYRSNIPGFYSHAPCVNNISVQPVELREIVSPIIA